MNIRNTLAGLALSAGALLSGQAEAETPLQAPYSDQNIPHAVPNPSEAVPSAKKHEHHNHLALGAEVTGNIVLASVLCTHELLDHWSLGAQVGLGADKHGKTAGNIKAVGTFHMGVVKPFYVVGELGVGTEFVGQHFEPVAEIAGLIGMKVNHTIGIAIGPAMIVTPKTVQPAATVNVAIGF